MIKWHCVSTKEERKSPLKIPNPSWIGLDMQSLNVKKQRRTILEFRSDDLLCRYKSEHTIREGLTNTVQAWHLSVKDWQSINTLIHWGVVLIHLTAQLMEETGRQANWGWCHVNGDKMSAPIKCEWQPSGVSSAYLLFFVFFPPKHRS